MCQKVLHIIELCYYKCEEEIAMTNRQVIHILIWIRTASCELGKECAKKCCAHYIELCHCKCEEEIATKDREVNTDNILATPLCLSVPRFLLFEAWSVGSNASEEVASAK